MDPLLGARVACRPPRAPTCCRMSLNERPPNAWVRGGWPRAIVPFKMSRLGRAAVAYLCLSGVAVIAALLWQGALPWRHPAPWFELEGALGALTSIGSGVVLGGIVVLATRLLVTHFAWARRLHVELRPLARGLSSPAIVLLAVLSSVGEELLFRGVLQPWMGLVPQAIVFGLLHYLPNRSRWAWVALATAVGLLLGALYQATGTLAGPIAAHAIVNGINLRHLRRHDPNRKPAGLGGLLGQRS